MEHIYYYFQFGTRPLCTKLADRPSLFRNLSESSDSSPGRVPRAGPVWPRNRRSFRFIRAITLKLARKTNRPALSGDPRTYYIYMEISKCPPSH